MATIIDAHAHLWLKQDTVVDDLPIRTLEGGRSLFMGEIRQMVPPFMVDGVNSAEVMLSNMDYAQVSAAVITQEYIDGIQNDYLMEVARRYPDRFLVCGMCEFRKPHFLGHARRLLDEGFRAIKIPAQRLLLKEGRVWLTSDEMMQLFHLMETLQVNLKLLVLKIAICSLEKELCPLALVKLLRFKESKLSSRTLIILSIEKVQGMVVTYLSVMDRIRMILLEILHPMLITRNPHPHITENRIALSIGLATNLGHSVEQSSRTIEHSLVI